MANPVEVADKVAQMAADALTPLERTIMKWPAEFREIVWGAVVVTAISHQLEASNAARSEKNGK